MFVSVTDASNEISLCKLYKFRALNIYLLYIIPNNCTFMIKIQHRFGINMLLFGIIYYKYLCVL
jgi:hypothetical protein